MHARHDIPIFSLLNTPLFFSLKLKGASRVDIKRFKLYGRQTIFLAGLSDQQQFDAVLSRKQTRITSINLLSIAIRCDRSRAVSFEIGNWLIPVLCAP